METIPSTETPDMLDEVLDLFRSMEELPQPDDVLPPDSPDDSSASAFKLPEPPPVWLADFDAVLQQAVFSELGLPIPTREEAESLLNELLREQAAEAASPPSAKVEEGISLSPLSPVLGGEGSGVRGAFLPSPLGGEGLGVRGADQPTTVPLPGCAAAPSPPTPLPQGERGEMHPSPPILLPLGDREEKPEPQTTPPLLRDLLPPLDEPPCSHAEALRKACLEGLNLSEDARTEAERGQPYLLIGLADAEYAIALGAVLEICNPLPMTPLPHVPHWIRGVSNLRGDILSVVDLGAFLGLSHTSGERGPAGSSHASRRPRLLVVHDKRADVTLGLLVDGAGEIRRFPEERLAPWTAPVEAMLQPYLLGRLEAGSRVLGVLDLERLLGRMNEELIP